MSERYRSTLYIKRKKTVHSDGHTVRAWECPVEGCPCEIAEETEMDTHLAEDHPALTAVTDFCWCDRRGAALQPVHTGLMVREGDEALETLTYPVSLQAGDRACR